jgi:hypothetical protein
MLTIQNGGTSGLYAELITIWGNRAALNPTEPPNVIFIAPAYQATANTNVDFDYDLYYSVLARDIDAGGFAFWLNVANASGNGILFTNSTARLGIEGPGTAGVGFVGSPEFQGTFNH